MNEPDTQPRLERWKRSLLDLTAANRLLDVKDGKTTIPLPSADPLVVAALLGEGATLTVGLREGEKRLRASLAKDELARRLIAIRRAARAQLADGGVHTLWLGLGLLTWCEAERRWRGEARAVSDEATTPVPADGEPQASLGGVKSVAPADGEPQASLGGVKSVAPIDGEATLPTKSEPVVVEDEQVRRVAPLVLWPVELTRVGDEWHLAEAPGLEPRINLTLVEKLRREGVELPSEGDEPDVATVLEAAEAIAATRPGWSVARAAQLGIFSFGKFVMWNDLHARADELLQRSIVAHLASGPGAAFAQPSVEADGQIAAALAQDAPPTDLLAPLDADASQLAAIAAAGAGASYVLQGPPGTGKSQTIANLIVHCVAHGKTVLFVTDKRAALEVVQQRLAAVGLGEFCLELHSHKAVRAQVVTQLGRVLERAFRPVSGPSGADGRLAELRDALDAHVAALNHVGPLGRSLHDVLGRLVELRSALRASLADRDATTLDGATFERRRLAVRQLAEAAAPIDPIATHPWRASQLERLPLDGRERAQAALDDADAAAASLIAAVEGLIGLVPGLVVRSRDQLELLGALAALAATSPRPGAELLTQLRTARNDDIAERLALIRARGAGALESPRDPGAFLVLANRHRALADEVNDRFTDGVEALDAPALWAQLRRWSRSFAPLRYLALREARAKIDAAAMPGQLDTDELRIAALEAVVAERAARAALLGAAEPAKRWFGELGGDPLKLDLPKIDAAVGWAAQLRRAFDAVDVAFGETGRAAAWRALVAQVAASPGDLGGDLARFTALAAAVDRWKPALAALVEATGIDAVTLGAGDDHLAALRARIAELRAALDGMRDWVAFHGARRAAVAAGVGPAITVVERGEIAATEIANAWERATLLAWADAALASSPALARFHGPAHHTNVSQFADLDRAALALIRSRALVRLAERVPRVTAEPGGELGTLLHEIKKQRGHRPLRRLFAEIPNLLPRLAPCLLMSPLSVAQYLDPALPKFDLVVFDEASQLPVADAIGALARGEAAVVVGDSRQLPPTRFFDVADAREDDDDASDEVELESVLDACVAHRLPELRLAWHYRSRHEDLIAFSNQRYYGDRLQVFPTALPSVDTGIAWRRVDGVYDRGRGRNNRVEAAAVVAEIVARFRDPQQRTRSLGVVTFSRAQQELVEDLLDDACGEEDGLEAWLAGDDSRDPVLVKNLETIQGDERDAVLVSVGYGPDASGQFPLLLGPLSQRGGERRLNVAITRAREQLVMFSSFDPEALDGAKAQGVVDLAALLAFARAGGGAARPSDEVPASPITAAIARALVERGWIVRHQVGCGAYKIDLAVVDPEHPERYALAIEHDGAAYASAPAARDRDRLRAQVLGQLGWRLHRIWALDWWADPERELLRAHGAVVAALAALRHRRIPAPLPAAKTGPRAARSSTAPPPPRTARATGAPAVASGSGPNEVVAALLADAAPAADGSAPIRLAKNAIAIGPYLAAAIPAGRRAPDDLFAPRHLAELGKIIEQVLAAEAPMHVDVLARRVGAYFGIGRLTQRVTDQVRSALDGRGKWGDEPDVVWRLDQDPASVPAVRVAGQGASARREIDEVPLLEIAAAARIVVERAVGIAANDLVRDAARLLGFARITDRVIERVATGIKLAARRELIRIASGKATLPDA